MRCKTSSPDRSPRPSGKERLQFLNRHPIDSGCSPVAHHSLVIEIRVSLPLLHVRAFSLVARPTVPSADFCHRFAPPLDGTSSRHGDRPPRVLRSHLPAYAGRIYMQPLRTGIGLRRYLPSSPDCMPHIRFLFVGPAFCLRLPSDSTSRWTPLPSG